MTLSIEERLANLEAAVAALKPIELGDLNSEYNNPRVYKSPKTWLQSGGIDYEGKRLSETSPEFCEAFAGFMEWKAGKEAEENKTYEKKATGERLPVAPLTRKDAARARAWAARLRGLSSSPAPAGSGYGGTGSDSDLPF